MFTELMLGSWAKRQKGHRHRHFHVSDCVCDTHWHWQTVWHVCVCKSPTSIIHCFELRMQFIKIRWIHQHARKQTTQVHILRLPSIIHATMHLQCRLTVLTINSWSNPSTTNHTGSKLPATSQNLAGHNLLYKNECARFQVGGPGILRLWL